jgi:tetratricopeptide (TPR) repeat protein
VISNAHPDREVCERALEHWNRFENELPLDSRLLDVLNHRALTYTKLSDPDSLQRAVHDYDRILAMVDGRSYDPGAMATWISNKAEILMMLGRLDDAIETYFRSLEYQDRALYGYGLAVALDRDGQGVKAREVMRGFAHADRLRDLTESTVFFVPKGEIHYYFGLGHEALGHADKAIEHYERFVASGAHPQFHDRARENIRALERERSDGGGDARDSARWPF